LREVQVTELGTIKLLDDAAASRPFRLMLAEPGPVRTARAAGAGHPFAAAVLARALDEPVLVVTADPRSADAVAAAAAAFLGPDRVEVFPAWESLPYEGISPAAQVAGRRARAAHRLRRAKGACVFVAPVAAAIQGLSPALGEHDALELAAGRTLPPDQLIERLADLGYTRADVVEHRGEFAVRGGLIDVFPSTARRPVRVDYWGDRIETLRVFSPATQLTTGKAEAIDVHPCRELPLDADARRLAGDAAPRYRGRYASLLGRLAEGISFEGMEQAIPLMYDRLAHLADLLPDGSWVVVASPIRTRDRAVRILEEAEALARAADWPGARAVQGLETSLGTAQRVELMEFGDAPDMGLTSLDSLVAVGPADALSRDRTEPTAASRRMAAIVARRAQEGSAVMVAAEGRGSLERSVEVLGAEEVDPSAFVHVRADISEGFVFDPGPGEPGSLTVVTEEDLFGRRRHTREAPRLTQRRADAVAEELEPGDLAVHQVHGVGRYVGMVRRDIGGAERDYLLLEYAQGDKLYVPSDQVGVVARYVGGEAPRLHRLGTNDWTKQKARVKRAVRDMAGELVRLYSVRMSVPGHPFGPDTPWQQELEDAFPFEETRDQLSAIDEVKRDMESPKPMDRLICGDVGYGKTEVAVRAAFKAVADGMQVAVLVPTTLLAEQHYVTFSERFAPFPATVAMISRFLSTAEQRRVLDDVASGKVDVVIGTHRLLSKDVSFMNLGLLIVDEEQRFGVSHKEQLKKLRASVDVLTMTATPIPRTLEMSFAGIRDMSVVDTPPEDRQSVLTYVGPWEAEMALTALRRELLRGGQAFWVHNRVETIERRAGWLREQIPDARIVVAHGQMEEERLEKVMLSFWERDADVLVCTTIVESGLDVPSANTLVVERADRLGLSQMYQLRGRVGRSAERAFAYFFFPPAASLTEEAHGRLEAIGRYTALGSGLPIAMRDLEIRGAGNLLGAEQHGHIAAVGFDTYVKLLGEAVAEMKGEPVAEERDIRIDLPVRAFIPPGWLEQESLRLELYRKVSTAGSVEGLAAVRAEAEDRFGELPSEVVTLFAIGRLRIAAAEAGVDEISRFRDQIRIRPVPEEHGAALAVARDDVTYHATTKTLNLVPPSHWGGEALVDCVEEALAPPGSTS
jgi:transcription-repair coupling factor (superfamily II helicase)